jgi:hypothetical protein
MMGAPIRTGEAPVRSQAGIATHHEVETGRLPSNEGPHQIVVCADVAEDTEHLREVVHTSQISIGVNRNATDPRAAHALGLTQHLDYCHQGADVGDVLLLAYRGLMMPAMSRIEGISPSAEEVRRSARRPATA